MCDALLQGRHGGRPLVPSRKLGRQRVLAMAHGLEAESLHIRIDHDRDQLFERHPGFPAQLHPGFGGIGLETGHLGGTKVA